MNKFLKTIRKIEFEARIFVSLGIVLTVCLVSFLVFPNEPSNMIRLGKATGLPEVWSVRIGFGLVAGIMVAASLLRMWAGTVLSSPRVMSFRIRKEVLATEGPYQISRNPIYLADLICFCGFALCFPPVGLALPVLLFLHYTQLIGYEEQSLEAQFGEAFAAYKKQTPRFIPGIRSIRRLPAALSAFRINRDGLRHNAQYVLLIPGFIVSAFTGNLLHAIFIGIPGVLDWAIVHTRIGLNPGGKDALKSEAERLMQSRVFKDIIYAQCWEDPDMDRKAFRITPSDVVFSITSGGCNTLTFLIDNPKKVFALDLSPYQNFLLDLKMAAFRELDYAELLEFVGVHPSSQRLELYRRLTKHLQPDSLRYWDRQHRKIERGIIHCGRYERYMRLLRKTLILLVGKSLLQDLYACKTREERQELYDRRWNNLRWKAFTKVCLSRTAMSFLFTRAFFLYLEESFSFGAHFREKAKKALVDLPLHENYFLAYILLGRYYSLDCLPVYLQKEHFESIKSRLDRIEIVTRNSTDFFRSLPANSITRFNFSNIFEWMPPEDFRQLLLETIRVAQDGSILTYRNLLVPRSRPAALADRIIPREQLAAELLENDRSFIYRAYNVEQISKSHAL